MDLKISVAALLLLIAGIGIAYAQWNHMKFMGRGNCSVTNINYTAEYQQFIQAIESGNYATAEQLHQQYGFGGKLFDKLNETTFAKYSQIYALTTELREELGMKGQPGAFPHRFVNRFKAGRFVGAHRHCTNSTNPTTTS